MQFEIILGNTELKKLPYVNRLEAIVKDHFTGEFLINFDNKNISSLQDNSNKQLLFIFDENSLLELDDRLERFCKKENVFNVFLGTDQAAEKLLDKFNFIDDFINLESSDFEIRVRLKNLSNLLDFKSNDSRFYSDKRIQTLMTTNKMANLGMLMPGIIHSVNNPMSLVFGNLEILKGNFKNFDPKKFRDEEEGKEFIEEGLGILSGLEKGSNRVIDVIKGVRNYIVGSDEGRIDTIPLIEVIDTVLIKCKYLLKNKIEIENKVNPSIQLKCNPRQVEQLLINILINCEENLYGNFDGHIHLMAKEEKNYILITIEDNGNILEGCQRIEKFYHFNEVAGRKDRSGLTLSCASLIAELNNGSFEIENNPNQGMSFYIVLPKE